MGLVIAGPGLGRPGPFFVSSYLRTARFSTAARPVHIEAYDRDIVRKVTVARALQEWQRASPAKREETLLGNVHLARRAALFDHFAILHFATGRISQCQATGGVSAQPGTHMLRHLEHLKMAAHG